VLLAWRGRASSLRTQIGHLAQNCKKARRRQASKARETIRSFRHRHRPCSLAPSVVLQPVASQRTAPVSEGCSMTKCTRIDDDAQSDDKGTGTDDEKTGHAAASPRSTTRRGLLQMGAGLAAISGVRRSLAAPAVAGTLINLPKAPNIIVLMTDQERHHVHWPQGWAEKNLPSLQRLKRHGLYFQRAYTAACQCSPSRGLMVTGRFAPVNRVTQTFLWPGLPYQDRQP